MSRLGQQSVIVGGRFLPGGSEVPAGVDVPPRYLDAAGVPTEGMSGVPPKGGPGSGRDAWAAYAAGKVEVESDASRDDIVAALDAAGVPTES